MKSYISNLDLGKSTFCSPGREKEDTIFTCGGPKNLTITNSIENCNAYVDNNRIFVHFPNETCN